MLGREENLDLVRKLGDGRKPFSKIAEEMGLAENTVRNRYRELVENGSLRVTALVDPAALPSHTLAFVGVRLRSMDFMGKAREFSKLRGVIAAGVVTGRFHLMLMVLLNSEFGLLEFYRDQVSTVSDVEDAETFVVYGSENLLIPYVL